MFLYKYTAVQGCSILLMFLISVLKQDSIDVKQIHAEQNRDDRTIHSQIFCCFWKDKYIIMTWYAGVLLTLSANYTWKLIQPAKNTLSGMKGACSKNKAKFVFFLFFQNKNNSGWKKRYGLKQSIAYMFACLARIKRLK